MILTYKNTFGNTVETTLNEMIVKDSRYSTDDTSIRLVTMCSMFEDLCDLLLAKNILTKDEVVNMIANNVYNEDELTVK